MDAQPRTRSCSRERLPLDESTPRGSKQICVPMTRDLYDRLWNDAGEVRRWLEPLIQASPELFPAGIEEGFQLTGHLPKVDGVDRRINCICQGHRTSLTLHSCRLAISVIGGRRRDPLDDVWIVSEELRAILSLIRELGNVILKLMHCDLFTLNLKCEQSSFGKIVLRSVNLKIGCSSIFSRKLPIVATSIFRFG
jgi:hypothetical protein